MQKKTKDLFADPFSNVTAPKAPAPARAMPAYIETTWTDKRTGAQYLVKEPAPPTPQGDFRVRPEIAEARYRAVMGLPMHSFDHTDRDTVDERLPSEPMVSQAEIDKKVRTRAMEDAKRENALRPTTERHVDTDEVVPDTKYNTIGLYGTEDVRHIPKAGRPLESRTIEATKGQVRPVEAPSLPDKDALLERLNSKPAAAVLLSEALRGIFGHQVADHIATRSQLSDRRPGFEKPTVSHVIMDLGLMKPWNAPRGKATNADRPERPDQVAHAVGLRAIETVLAKKTAPEILELPAAEKDDLAVAIGRTLLNAMAILPEKAAEERPALEARLRDEIQAAISASVDPQVLKGLIAPEAVSDRPVKDPTAMARTTGAESKAMVPVDRLASEAPDRIRANTEAIVRPTLGQFAAFGHTRRKDLFNMNADERPVAREEPAGHGDRPRIATMAFNERPETRGGPMRRDPRSPTRSTHGQFSAM